jgi:hypothetical protein
MKKSKYKSYRFWYKTDYGIGIISFSSDSKKGAIEKFKKVYGKKAIIEIEKPKTIYLKARARA